MRAGLMFRVGRTDETLARGGISHLVEHLALYRHGVADYHYNGATGLTTTQFTIQGSPEDVVAFLNGVCASLHQLPVERLAIEQQLIKAESLTRPTAVNAEMALWRHGARDFGLSSYPEFGVHTVTAEDVLEWAQSRFTRDNAVLWIAGEQIPAGLNLDLPSGSRYPLPEASSTLPVTPAYFNGSSQMLVMDAKVPRTRAGAAYARALERALFRSLRQEGGLSYLTATSYDSFGGPTATVTAAVDTLPDKQQETVERFLTVVRRLATHELEPAELATVRSMELETLADPEVEARLLPRRATDLLTGFPSSSTAEMVDGFEKLAADDIREVAEGALASALVMVPPGHVLERYGFEAAPTYSRFAVTGTRHRSKMDPRIALIRGAEGVSLSMPHGPTTVLFADCAAVLRWPDGARHFLGADAITVRIEPTLFSIAPAVIDELDRAVPQAVIVDLPAREPENIPKASARKSARRRLRLLVRPIHARLHRAAIRYGGIRDLMIKIGLAVGLLAVLIGAIVARKPAPIMAGIIAAMVTWSWRRGRR